MAVGVDRTVRIDAETLPDQYFDVAVEASGASAAVGATLAAVRRRGVVVQLGMFAPGPRPAELSALVAKEIDYRGAFRFDTEFDESIALLAGLHRTGPGHHPHVRPARRDRGDGPCSRPGHLRQGRAPPVRRLRSSAKSPPTTSGTPVTCLPPPSWPPTDSTAGSPSRLTPASRTTPPPPSPRPGNWPRSSTGPNVLIKIPATPAGLPAITAVIAQGISVNVTLIFRVRLAASPRNRPHRRLPGPGNRGRREIRGVLERTTRIRQPRTGSGKGRQRAVSHPLM